MECKTMVVCNQKGGVGKTVTTVNLGIGLARLGKRVLLVDVDAQGALTASLGHAHPDSLPTTLTTILTKIANHEHLANHEGILHHQESVDLMLANIELSGLEVSLVNVISRETILRRYLKTLRDDYDFIILDTTPSLGIMTVNALAAADKAIIPVQAQYLSIKGLEQLLKTIRNVRKELNPELDIAGILLTMVDNRTNYAREIISLLHDEYDGKLHIYDNPIPMSVRAAEISAERTSIYLHDPKGKVSAAYESLTREVLSA